MKNKLITGVIAGIILLVSAGGVSAVMTTEDLETKKAERDAKKEELDVKREEKKTELDAKKTEIQERRCEKIKERMRTRAEKFEGNNKYHQKNFNGINNNIKELLELFQNEGLDTVSLENYLEILEEKLKSLYEDHDSFVATIESSADEVDCANIEEGVKNRLQLAKKEGELIKADILDIKDYYKEIIRPELISLRQEYLGIIEEELDNTEKEYEEKEEVDGSINE